MSYNDKYPDMSAMYAVQFEYENKLKDKIKELETELERTRKALEIIKKEMKNEYMPDFAVIRDALKTALEQKD